VWVQEDSNCARLQEKKIQTKWFTCGTFEDGNVVEVGAVGGEFDVKKTRPVMRVVGNSNAK
jgi:hypothetical protein